MHQRIHTAELLHEHHDQGGLERPPVAMNHEQFQDPVAMISLGSFLGLQ